jgi:hypothetical protein
VVEAGRPAERGDHGTVQTAHADGWVGQVDDGVPGGVQVGESGADGHGLAGADLPGEQAERVLVDQPANAGDGFGVAAVAVQRTDRDGAAERHAGEPVVRLQLLDAHRCSPGCSAVSAGSASWMLGCPSMSGAVSVGWSVRSDSRSRWETSAVWVASTRAR